MENGAYTAVVAVLSIVVVAADVVVRRVAEYIKNLFIAVYPRIFSVAVVLALEDSSEDRIIHF